MAYVRIQQGSRWNDDEDQLTNNPYKSIANYQNRMEQVGVNPPAPTHKGLGNFAMTALDVIDRPRKTLANTLNEILAPQKYEGGIGTAVLSGLSGQRNTGFGEVMDNMGYKSNPNKQWWQTPDNLIRSTVGFVGDVAMDPLTYLSAGAVPLAKSLGKGGLTSALSKTLGTDIAGKADDVLRNSLGERGMSKFNSGGFNALNGDDIAQVKANVHGVREGQVSAYGTAKKDYNSMMGLAFGLNSKAGKGPFDLGKRSLDEQKGFLQSIQEALDGNVHPDTQMLHANEHSFDQMGNLMNNVPGVRSLDPSDATDALTATVYNVLKETFGEAHKIVNGQRVYDDGLAKLYHDKAQDIVKRIAPKTPNETPRYMSHLWEKAEAYTQAKNALGEVEESVKLANGIERVYNQAQKRTYLKFAGKPLFEVTGAVAQGQKILDAAVMSNRFTREVANTVGRAFDTQHVDLNLKKQYPEVYEALRKNVVPLINKYSRKSSAIPAETLKYAHQLFAPEFLSNKKLRESLAYYVEGGERIGDASKFTVNQQADMDAQIAFMKLQATLTDEEHLMLTKAATAVQMATDAMHNVEKTIWETLSASKQERIGYEALEKNYIPHVYRKDDQMIASATMLKDEKSALARAQDMKISASNQRKFHSLAQAETMGGKEPVKDIVALMAHRKLEHSKFTTAMDFHRDLARQLKDNPALKDVISTKKDSHMLQFGTTGLYVSPYIAEQFNRLAEVTNQSLGARGLLKIFDDVTNILKTLQTNMNPAFVAKNLIGESLMTVADGVNDPRIFKLAHDLATNKDHQRFAFDDRMFYYDGKLVFARQGNSDEIIMGKDFGKKANMGPSKSHTADPKTGKFPEEASTMRMPAETFRNTRGSFEEMCNDWIVGEVEAGRIDKNAITVLNGQTYSKAFLWHKFLQEGLYQHGMAKGNMIKSIDSEVASHFTGKNMAQKMLHAMPSAADYGESVARFAHFAGRLDAGDGFEEAATRVRAWHVDYKDLTPVERGFMRRVMPYYTYMRKNTPMQFKHLVTDPSMYATVFKLIRNSTDALYAQGGVSPDYLMESMAIPMGTDDEGNTVYLNANLPLTDLNRLKYDVGEGFSKNVLEMLHPAIKSTFELGMNQSMAFDTPVEKYEGQTTNLLPGVDASPRIPKKLDYMLQQTGIVQSLRKTLGAGVAAQTGQEPDPAKPMYSTNSVANAGATLMSSMFPLKNQEATRLQNAYQYRDELQSYAKMLKEEHGVVLPSANTKSKGRTYVKFPNTN